MVAEFASEIGRAAASPDSHIHALPPLAVPMRQHKNKALPPSASAQLAFLFSRANAAHVYAKKQ